MTKLNERSKQIRRDTYVLSKSNGGYHYGGSFSCVEILIALFDHVMTPEDKFVLSKGHGCWPFYVLLQEKGYQPRLSGHPERDIHNGVESTTGSLGHGLPFGIGMAFAKKFKGEPGRVFVLMGDGETQEGTTWESLLIGTKFCADEMRCLNNLVVIVDDNRIQGSNFISDTLHSTQYLDSVAFNIGWSVRNVDGHDVAKITDAINRPPSKQIEHTRTPLLIIAETIKGKGVSFMEGQPKWHAKWPNDEEEQLLLEELQ